MGTQTPQGVMPTDWNVQLEAANRHVAELEQKIGVQNDTLHRLSGEGADTQNVTRILAVLKQNLERATLYKHFIETSLDPTPERQSAEDA
jgi:hypothetical protein